MLSLVKLLVIGIAVFSTTFLVQATPLKAQNDLIQKEDPPPLDGLGQMNHLNQSGEAYDEYELALAVNEHTKSPPNPPEEENVHVLEPSLCTSILHIKRNLKYHTSLTAS